ncbi:hypothetical protein [Dankookia rubra]|uniref:hypothetical protein n=1 Tax=Dankookia rubra TaxID=1442381 RepID=UPI00140992BE|nr:hypothetical protein [Dankookia rubra]
MVSLVVWTEFLAERVAAQHRKLETGSIRKPHETMPGGGRETRAPPDASSGNG